MASISDVERVSEGRVYLRDVSQMTEIESISLSIMVARLSVITTESSRNPAALPSGEETGINTRLGWLRRARLLEIIATIVCSRLLPRLSR